MKLTKLSVLFSSLYFGLVGSSFSSPTDTKLTFKEVIERNCGIRVNSFASNQGYGSILFNDETNTAPSESYATFTPYDNDSSSSTGTFNIRLVEFSGSVNLHGGKASATEDHGIWIGNDKSQAKFSNIAQLNTDIAVPKNRETHVIAVVNHDKSEIAANQQGYIINATIRMNCEQ